MARSRIEESLRDLGIVLPALPLPGGNYLPARTVGQIVCFAGAFSEIFGDAGRHVRAAIGVPALPRNALVELQMTVEV